MAWLFLTHPDVTVPSLIPDNPDALSLFQSRGWELAEPPEGLDLDDPNAQAVLTELLTGGPVRLPAPAPQPPPTDAGQVKPAAKSTKKTREGDE